MTAYLVVMNEGTIVAMVPEAAAAAAVEKFTEGEGADGMYKVRSLNELYRRFTAAHCETDAETESEGEEVIGFDRVVDAADKVLKEGLKAGKNLTDRLALFLDQSSEKLEAALVRCALCGEDHDADTDCP